MSQFAVFMSCSLAAVFTENVLFKGAAGIPEVEELCRRPRRALLLGALISLFSFTATALSLPFFLLMPYEMSYIPLSGLILSLAVLLSYFIAARLVLRLEKLRDRVGPYLAPAAINAAVLALPLAANRSGMTSPAQLLGLSLGSGAGFLLACLLIAAGKRTTEDPMIPEPVRGTPAMLIYIGLISLSLSVLGGGLDFI